MRNIYYLFLLLSCFLFFNCKGNTKKSYKKDSVWISLFNGKDLDGWTPKINGYKLGDNYKNTFRVKDGAIIVSYSEYDHFTDEFGHLFYKSPFTNYRLKLQYRITDEQVKGGNAWATKNSGIMIHCQSPKSMLQKQSFPISLEFQLLGGINLDEDRPSGNLCTPGTHVTINNELTTEHCIQAKSETIYGEQWVDAEVIVNNDNITHMINGKPVISYAKPIIGGQFLDSASEDYQKKEGQSLRNGYIALQSESHPIEFRNIKILEL